MRNLRLAVTLAEVSEIPEKCLRHALKRSLIVRSRTLRPPLLRLLTISRREARTAWTTPLLDDEGYPVYYVGTRTSSGSHQAAVFEDTSFSKTSGAE